MLVVDMESQKHTRGRLACRPQDSPEERCRVEAHPSSVPQLSRGRIEALKRLERSERALADVYRYHPHDLPGGEETVQRLAREHLAHAALLRGRIEALGHEAHPDPDDAWV